MNNYFFRIQSKIYREIGSLFKYRPTSYPYISGDGFRSMSDHIYDETVKCSAESIKDGQIVFLKGDMMHDFFKEIHPKIKCQYILITHNSDAVIGEAEAKNIDSKIIKWFAQNNTYKHDKIVPIPIGIENRKWYINGWILEKMSKKLLADNTIRKNRVLFGFNINTNISERTSALNALRKCPIADEIKNRINPIEYFRLLNRYKFVASPEGNGPDCIRTYEAMILGVVPVIKNSSNNQIFIQNNLPVLIVEDWGEIENKCLNYDFSIKSDITMFDYWEKMIKKNE